MNKDQRTKNNDFLLKILFYKKEKRNIALALK